MSIYATLCVFYAGAMVIALLNSHFLKLQTTVAITGGAMLLSILVILFGHFEGLPFIEMATGVLERIDFEDFLLKELLGILLFAGAIGIRLKSLKNQQWEIIVLAFFATLCSTFIVGFLLYQFCQLVGVNLQFIHCLLFGALISPTDPIAVLAIIKKRKAPEAIANQIEGESLFNDGFGLVIFVTLFTVAFNSEAPTVSGVLLLFLREAIGGIIYGIILGFGFHRLILSTEEPTLQLLLTIAIPSVGYLFAEILTVSGPLAMVVAGIIIGNWTREKRFSKENSDHFDVFWRLTEDLFNSLLFLLIGMALLLCTFHLEDWIFMLAAIPIALTARYISVFISIFMFKRHRIHNSYTVPILTWGGLRGGLALAMALTIPAGIMVIPSKEIDVREIILVMTYAVVIFSILVQGSTIGVLIEKAKKEEKKLPKRRKI